LKTLPEISGPEKVFVRNLVANCTPGEAFECAWPKEAKDLSETARTEIGKRYERKTHIKQWVRYLRDAKPDELINQLYLDQIAFGTPKDQLSAADAFINSQYAGKEVAEIFMKTLQEIHAQVVVPCGKHLDRVDL
jgi:hypothetical protein